MAWEGLPDLGSPAVPGLPCFRGAAPSPCCGDWPGFSVSPSEQRWGRGPRGPAHTPHFPLPFSGPAEPTGSESLSPGAPTAGQWRWLPVLPRAGRSQGGILTAVPWPPSLQPPGLEILHCPTQTAAPRHGPATQRDPWAVESPSPPSAPLSPGSRHT